MSDVISRRVRRNGGTTVVQERERITKDLQELGQEWATAELRGDTAFHERRLADDFIAVGPRGFMLTKDQWIARYQSGDLKHDSLEWSDATPRVYGETAVVIGRQTAQGSYQGHPIGGAFRTTLIFIRQDGEWRIASLHLSPIVEG